MLYFNNYFRVQNRVKLLVKKIQYLLGSDMNTAILKGRP